MLLAADEVRTAEDIAPLVVTAHFELATVIPVEAEKIVALHEHIAEFEEGQAALIALLIAFRAEHLVYGEMDCDIAHEVHEIEIAEPVGVIDEDSTVLSLKIYEA